MVLIGKERLENILEAMVISVESLTPSEKEKFTEIDWITARRYNNKISEILNYIDINVGKRLKNKSIKEAKKLLKHFKDYLGIYHKGEIQIELLKKDYSL